MKGSPMSRGPKIAIAILVVALVAGGLWWRLRPAPVAQGVVFVGDSVTYLSLPELEHQIARDHPQVVARVGYRSEDLLPLVEKVVAERRAAHQPLRQAVFLVGYNDVIRGPVDSPALGIMMNLANQFDCAIWLTIPTVPLREQQTAVWNARVNAAAHGLRHVHVVDTWRRAVDAAPPGKLVTRRDGVHPNAVGAERLTQIFIDAIHHSC
jgi:hypothetical protein